MYQRNAGLVIEKFIFILLVTQGLYIKNVYM